MALITPFRQFINRFLFGNSLKGSRHNTIHVGKSLLTETSILIEGKGNAIWIGDDVRIFKARLVIRGNGCSIKLTGPGYFSGKLICGDMGSCIEIGSGVTAEDASLVAYEGTSIHIGNDCALSWGVEIHSSDSHAIYDASGKKLNPARNIEVHRHVWVAQGATILKGAIIGEGAVVGARALVSQSTPIPPHTIAVGIPASPICSDIHWRRERNG